ncbi:DUF4283 domain-containing protein [Raphanus sativus]|nr:DUF4283 domain-containing protein [Raphanus sativus]
MLILQRWEPIVSDSFPALIPFWIKVHGIPLHYWTEDTLRAIGKALGPVDGFDVDQGKVRVFVNALKPLEMKLEISLAGDFKQVELQYLNLQKHCFACKALSYEVEECPTSKARANIRDPNPVRADISQNRTLEKLEADRRRREAKKYAPTISEANTHSIVETDDINTWIKPSYREEEGRQGTNPRYDYGVRRDPYHRREEYVSEDRALHSRRPARERLSGTLESNYVSHRSIHSHKTRSPQRSEWRPISGNSHSGNRAKAILPQSHSSRTPSPRPPREAQTFNQEKTLTAPQNSGARSTHSNERRSALERISQPTERIPLLQDGVANSASGRLQEVDIQYMEETLPLHRSGGSNNNPLSSKHPQLPSARANEGMLDRSPIRTLSEDRLHVSLRLGPLAFDSDGNTQQSSRDEASPLTGLILGKGKASAQPAARKRILRSPVQGATPKRRRVEKTENSPRRKLMGDAMKANTRAQTKTGEEQPRTTMYHEILIY